MILQVTLAAWGAGLVYGCAVGGDEIEPSDCLVGSEGCACTEGGGCDPNLQCLSDFCVDVAGTGGNTSAPNAGVGGGSTSSAGGAPTTSTTTGSSMPTTGTGPSTTTGPTTTGSGSCALPEPTNVHGCTGFCDICESWPFSWDAVAGATHYRIRWSCSIAGENVSQNITGTTTDFANGPEVNAGGLGCGFSIHSVYVMACDGTCCTNGTAVPVNEIPATCGGGCCG